MAVKKQTTRKSSTKQDEAKVDSNPEVKAASERLRKAREELLAAEKKYEEIKQKATEQVERLREATVGDLIDSTLDTVKKHPGLSILAATALGYFLGRLFRK